MEIKSSYKLEEIDDRYFVFDGGTGNIFEINRIMYELLLGKSETELRDRFSSVEISDVKNSMIEAMDRGILSEQNLLTRTYQRIGGKNVHSLNTLFLNVAQKCNLKCSYCFGQGGSYGFEEELMSIETAKKCMDYWLENIDNKKQNFVVAFFGGEPLLNTEVICFVVDYLNAKKKDISGNIKYMITTNGTILNDEIIKIFAENNFLVSISLDGIKKIHDKNRPFISGKDSMELIVKNTQRLLKYYTDINCQITLRKEDIPFLSEGVIALWGIGVNKVYSNIVFGEEEEYHEGDYKELEHQIDILRDLTYQNLLQRKTQVYGSLFDQMQNIHVRNYAINCFLWKEKIAAFASSGDAYTCYRLVGNKDFLLGNVFQEGFSVFCKPFEKQIVEKCSRCYYQLYCGEGCPYENLVYNADINIPADEWCAKNKILFDASLKLYLKIKVKLPDLFKELCDSWEENK